MSLAADSDRCHAESRYPSISARIPYASCTPNLPRPCLSRLFQACRDTLRRRMRGRADGLRQRLDEQSRRQRQPWLCHHLRQRYVFSPLRRNRRQQHLFGSRSGDRQLQFYGYLGCVGWFYFQCGSIHCSCNRARLWIGPDHGHLHTGCNGVRNSRHRDHRCAACLQHYCG